MFIVKVIVIALFYDTLCKSSGIIIGYIPGQVYVPSSSSGSPPISYYFGNNCQECLCRAIMSTNSSFVAINCLTISHLCMFYTNYATNFTIKSNSTAYLYLFQSLPQLTAMMTNEDDNARNINNGSDDYDGYDYNNGYTDGPCSPPSSGYIAMITNASSSYQFYSYLITAQYTSDFNLNFIFQGDSLASWHLDDISLTPFNESNSELLVDGGFENPSNGWTLNCWEGCEIGSSGLLSMNSCHSGSMCYIDACTGAYDFLFQSVNLTSGNVYNLSFWLFLSAGGSSVSRAYINLQ